MTIMTHPLVNNKKTDSTDLRSVKSVVKVILLDGFLRYSVGMGRNQLDLS